MNYEKSPEVVGAVGSIAVPHEVVSSKTVDIIKSPDHYAKWPIEPITFIMRNRMEFWRGNIIKYATRAGHKQYEGMDKTKSEITDLKKIIRYAEMRINYLTGEQIL